MAAHVLTQFRLAQCSGETFDFFSPGNLGVLLVTPAHTHDPEAAFVDEVSAGEVAMAGYSRKALENVQSFVDSSDPDPAEWLVVITANDVVWASLAAGNVGGAYLYYTPGAGDAARRLVAWYDPPDEATAGLPATLAFSDSGVIAL